MKSPLDAKLKEYVCRSLAQIEGTAKNGLWHAHWGCAVIAGALLLADDLVEPAAKPSLENLLDSLAVKEKGFSPVATLPPPDLEKSQFHTRLLAALAETAEEPREIGHTVIYSAYVLKALDRFDIPPWESLLTGLVDLIHAINAASPGWITINGVNERKPLGEAATKTSADYWAIFSEFDRPQSMEIGDMQLGHLLTHGHAIQMMKAYASPALVTAFDQGFRRRLPVLRDANLVQEDKTPLPHRTIDPRNSSYWKSVQTHGDMHGHAIKYAYSFLALRGKNISPEDLAAYGRIVWPDQSAPVAIN